MKKREFDLVLGSSWSPSVDTDLLSSAAQSTEGGTSAHLTAKVNIALSGIVRRQKPGEVMELAQCHCGLEPGFETTCIFGFICPRTFSVAGPGLWNPHLHSLALTHHL